MIWDDFPDEVTTKLDPRAGVESSRVRGEGDAWSGRGWGWGTCDSAEGWDDCEHSVKTGDGCGWSGVETTAGKT